MRENWSRVALGIDGVYERVSVLENVVCLEGGQTGPCNAVKRAILKRENVRVSIIDS